MITINEYAALSAHIYNPYSQDYGAFSFKPATAREIPNKDVWSFITDVDANIKPANHFFCQLYLKFTNQQATDAVIAIRGTVFPDKINVLNDILAWGPDILGDCNKAHTSLPYLTTLINFVIKAQDYIRKHFHSISHLRFTGHSLGGALAQLIPLSAGFSGEAIAFNAPGIGNFPGLILNNQHWIYNINSRYGFINKIGKRHGFLIEIDVPEQEEPAKQIFAEIEQKDVLIIKYYYQKAEHLANNQTIKMFWQIYPFFLNIIALHYRVKSYTETLNRVEPVLQNNHDKQNLAKLYRKISNISALGNIIAEQHSIDNLVRALHRPENAAFAHRCL